LSRYKIVIFRKGEKRCHGERRKGPVGTKGRSKSSAKMTILIGG